MSTIIPESWRREDTLRAGFPPEDNDGQGRRFYFADSPLGTRTQTTNFHLVPYASRSHYLPTTQFGRRRFSCDKFLGRRERANFH